MHPADDKLEDEWRKLLARERKRKRFELAKAAVPTMIRLLQTETSPWGLGEAAASCVEFADAVLAALDAKAGREAA